MFKKVIVIVLVLLLSGTTSVLANLNNNPFAGMFANVPAGLQGTPVEKASDERAEDQTIDSAVINVQATDTDDEDGPPPWFDDMDAYNEWLDSGMEGPPPWAPVHAQQNWVRSMSGERDNDEDDDEDGPPPWFEDEVAYQQWLDSGMEGPPPWAPVHAQQNWVRSMSGERDNDEDDDEDGPPPWFKNQVETEDWIDGGRQGPPPWTPAHARNNAKKSQE